MSKRVVGTVLALLLSVGIAVGGLYLLSFVLDREEQVLISQKGKEELQRENGETGEEDGSGSVSYSREQTVLTEDELCEVLKNMKYGEMEYPHEPYYGQLTMTQAVDQGKVWLTELKQKHKNLEPVLEDVGDKVSAHLSREAMENEQVILGSNRILSHWELGFAGKNSGVNMKMNAVTGQVLELYIWAESIERSITADEREALLNSFVSQFKLPVDGLVVTEQKSERMSVSLADGKFYGVEESYAGIYDMSMSNAAVSGGKNVKEKEPDYLNIHLFLELQ